MIGQCNSWNSARHHITFFNVFIKGIVLVVEKSDINFRKHIETLCRTAHLRLHAIRRIRKYLTLVKAKLSGNSFIENQSYYAPLLWMLYHKALCLNMQNSESNQSDASYCN